MSDDVIYRQAAIDALHSWERVYNWDETCRQNKEKVYAPSDAIEALPTAESERKTGKWIPIESLIAEDVFGSRRLVAQYMKCSNCSYWGDVTYMLFRYCPNCGADMRGDENGE